MLEDALHAVREMCASGLPFERVEAQIESLSLGEEQKGLLWLYAWMGGEAAVTAALLGRLTLAAA